MRLRLVLGVAAALVLGVLLLNMSRSAPRGAGSDHALPTIFVATMPATSRLCQPGVALPEEAARVQLLIGSYGLPLPAIDLSFTGERGAVVATGHLKAGGREGEVTIPVVHRRGAGESSSVCFTAQGHHHLAIGGEGLPVNPGSAVLDGRSLPGKVSVVYLRSGSESWWQLLPTLARRFGLGKAPIFGTWTLPALALLLVGLWFATIRLLGRELR